MSSAKRRPSFQGPRSCGFTEAVRPKKWWPDFSYLSCERHSPDELPEPALGLARREVDGIGSRFVGVVDERA